MDPRFAPTAPRSVSAVEPPGRATTRRVPVSRDRLISRLAAGADKPLVVISAPAGFGKTTLLSQWVESDPRSVARVALNDWHDDPVVLTASIARAVGAHIAIPDDVFAALHGAAAAALKVAVPRLLEVIGRSESDLVIALDDVHKLLAPTTSAIIEALADNLPAGSQLVLASRSKPAIHLTRRRLEGSLLELRSPDLAMTPREAKLMLRGEGVRLADESLQALVVHTEGWPAALALAAISLGTAEDADAAATRFAGDDRLVSDYMREELIPGLPDDELAVLTRTSILDELSGEACDAVLEASGSADILRRIADSNALLTPLGATNRRFRCHALLREMLEAELDAQSPGLKHRLHLRAARWFAEHADDPARAVHHAIAGEDPILAGALIWGQAGALLSTGHEATLTRWLRKFSSSQIEATPTLCLVKAALSLSHGDGPQIEHWSELAVGAQEHTAEPDPTLTIAATAIRISGAGRSDLATIEEGAGAAFRALPAGDPWRSLCRFVEGAARHLSGDTDSARAMLEESARLGAVGAPHIRTLASAQLALLALDQGDPGRAAALTAEFCAQAELFGVTEYPTSALLWAVAGLVHASGGQVEQAVADVRSGLALLEQIDEMSNWYETEIQVTLARALIALDDVPAARDRLGEAERLIKGVDDATALRGWIRQAWLDADAATAALHWPLTPAELRLLHLLPTHLGLAEIAGELIVSVNTVKSQAQSIYRKLGVSSRAEAVACAQQVGLLGRGPGPMREPPAAEPTGVTAES